MKITKVEVMRLNPRQPETNKIRWRPVVCRIYTDEGIYGDGEAAVAYGTGAPGAFGVLQDLAPLIIGMDPLDNEVVWDKLFRDTFWGENGGAIFYAGMSAIDIALWDIRGKYFKVPVYKLLGGKRRESIRCYASQLQFGWGTVLKSMVTPADYAKAARAAVDDGYNIIKIDFLKYDDTGRKITSEQATRALTPHQMRCFEERLSAVRTEIGPDVDIMIENHGISDEQTAVQIARMAEKYNIFCMEEPAIPSARVYESLHKRTSIPLACGERIFTRWGYIPYFEKGVLQIAQPDIGTCGGITECKKIIDMAYAYDVAVQVHVCSTGIAQAAALHLEACCPNIIFHEHHIRFRTDYNRELCKNDFQPVDGCISFPNEPGIGNELSNYAIETATKVSVTESGSHI